jgi:hypothetical protein
MPQIVTRAGKGSPLTNDEMDANLVNIEKPTMEVWSHMVGSFFAAPKGRYFCAGANIVATLPVTPPDNTEIWFSGSFSTDNMVILRNGATIAGVAQDLILDLNNIMPKLVYQGGDWKVSQ